MLVIKLVNNVGYISWLIMLVIKLVNNQYNVGYKVG